MLGQSETVALQGVETLRRVHEAVIRHHAPDLAGEGADIQPREDRTLTRELHVERLKHHEARLDQRRLAAHAALHAADPGAQFPGGIDEDALDAQGCGVRIDHFDRDGTAHESERSVVSENGNADKNLFALNLFSPGAFHST